MIEQLNARLENPVVFGHATPADALVRAFDAAALAVLARLVMARMRAVRT